MNRNASLTRPANRARLAALALAWAVFLGGCAAKTPSGSENEARAVWAQFRAAAEAPAAPFSVQASLNFSAPGKSHRVLLKLWGDAGYPLRLDFAAGLGQIFSMWREDAAGWLAYYPMSHAAYSHPDTRKGAAMLGMPLPLSLRELAAVICGRFGEFVPREYQTVKTRPGGLEYALKGDPRLSSVTLDAAGRPVGLAGKGLEPWRVEFSDYQDSGGRELPQMIVVTTPGGLKGVVRIKKYEERGEPWPPSALNLPLPENTTVYALDLMPNFKKPDVGGGQ
jgi:outer membrane biogenesis lipoprotein LolB